MYSTEDLKSLHGFLRTAGEGNLKKMLVGGKLTDVYFRVLLKIARATKDEEFAANWIAGTVPKVKFSQEEAAVKETCYAVCGEVCAKLGLLSGEKAA